MATLEQRMRDLITALGTDFKATRAMIGTLTSLSTTEKGSIVGAINEVRAIAAAASGNTGGAVIDDVTATNSTTYSSNKIVAAIQAARTVINDTTASGTSVYSSTKVNTAITALIDDATTVTGKTWSSSKTQAVVNAAVASLVGGAPGTLDALNELAAALGNDANFATTMTTALGNRVRFDAAQTLTAAQKVQVKANIDALGTLEIGNPDADFVAAYVLAKQ